MLAVAAWHSADAHVHGHATARWPRWPFCPCLCLGGPATALHPACNPRPWRLQATLTYARDLEDLVAAGNPTEEASAEGVTFLRTIEPLVEQVAPKQAAAVAGALLAPAAGNPLNAPSPPHNWVQIQAVLKSAQDALGISAAELGALDAPSACQ